MCLVKRDAYMQVPDRSDTFRGRGAGFNPPNRFIDAAYVEHDEVDEPYVPSLELELLPDASKSLIASNDSPDLSFDRSVNPYRGCEHGCSYCFARPTHEYLGYSAGIDFETKILVKHDAPKLLRQELMRKSWQPQVVFFSGVTDCYQPIERRLQLTRQCLEVLAEFRNPAIVLSKNALVARDIDVFARLAEHHAIRVMLSITSLDADLIGLMEPRTSRPKARLGALRRLSGAGIPCGVMIGPIIPGLTDHEVPSILEAAAKAGAQVASWTALRLPHAVAPIFQDWLQRAVPGQASKILSKVRGMREGKLNESDYFRRHRPAGAEMAMVKSMFEVTCKRLGLNREIPPLSTASFQRPGEQLGLF